MKNQSKELNERGNAAFHKKKFDDAEKCFSEAIKLNMGSKALWTNRAKCRNAMKKHEEAILDCESALSINPKCHKTVEEKGNAILGLDRFDDAKTCFESLCQLGESALAETYLKKLHDIQDRVEKCPKKKRIQLTKL